MFTVVGSGFTHSMSNPARPIADRASDTSWSHLRVDIGPFELNFSKSAQRMGQAGLPVRRNAAGPANQALGFVSGSDIPSRRPLTQAGS